MYYNLPTTYCDGQTQARPSSVIMLGSYCGSLSAAGPDSDRPFSWGIGATVNSVIESPGFLEKPHEAAEQVWERSNRGAAANGALMRTSILGVPHFWDQDRVVAQTLDICCVTHADPRCKASCVAATVAIAKMLQGVDDIKDIVSESHDVGLRQIVDKTQQAEYSDHVRALTLAELMLGDTPKIGYTLKALGSAFWALRNAHLGFRIAMMRIFQQGGDADTNGAIAGAILGCYLGFSRLPQTWVEGLVHREFLLEKVDHLCQAMGL